MTWDPRIEKKCSDCKTIKPRTEYRINQGRMSTYCIPCSNERDMLPATRFKRSIWLAKRKGVEWGLTLEQFSQFVGIGCSYCGGPLARLGSNIDRIDNTKGYFVDNCVPSCGICNWVRFNIFTHAEMKILGKAVGEIRVLRGLGLNEGILATCQMGRTRRDYKPRKDKGVKRGPMKNAFSR
jgi:hypothetical protein